jgi:transposase-like protein
MARRRYQGEQIVGLLREAERSGMPLEAFCKQHGVSEQTFYRWKKQYGGNTAGAPRYIRCDNGPEFIAQRLREFLQARGVKVVYIEPGSPWQNGYRG